MTHTAHRLFPKLGRRGRRGFSMIEALTAGVIFFVGVTGVVIMIQHLGMLTRYGALNTQMVQLARNELSRRTMGGLAGIGVTQVDNVFQLQSGLVVISDTEVFNTGGPVGATPPAQLPGCENLGYASNCVRVTVRDCMNAPLPAPPPIVPECNPNRKLNRYQVAAYVTN